MCVGWGSGWGVCFVLDLYVFGLAFCLVDIFYLGCLGFLGVEFVGFGGFCLFVVFFYHALLKLSAKSCCKICCNSKRSALI